MPLMDSEESIVHLVEWYCCWWGQATEELYFFFSISLVCLLFLFGAKLLDAPEVTGERNWVRVFGFSLGHILSTLLIKSTEKQHILNGKIHRYVRQKILSHKSGQRTTQGQ